VVGGSRQSRAECLMSRQERHITTPVWQAANNIPPMVWWNNLERVLRAIDALGCHDLPV
jgi:hypothetical protein